MNFLKNAILIIIALSIVAHVFGKEETKAPDYSGVWSEQFNQDITIALARNNIEGCGQYEYQQNLNHSGEYKVKCTRDGENWVYYLVWWPSARVMGPYFKE